MRSGLVTAKVSCCRPSKTGITFVGRVRERTTDENQPRWASPKQEIRGQMSKLKIKIGDEFYADGSPELVRHAMRSYCEIKRGVAVKPDWICSKCNARNSLDSKSCWACSSRSAFQDGPFGRLDRTNWPASASPEHICMIALKMAAKETKNDLVRPMYEALAEFFAQRL